MKLSRNGIAVAVQAALIVLPLAVLSAMGLQLIRFQRTALVEGLRESATLLAPKLAEQIAKNFSASLSGASLSPLEGLIANGHIQSPQDYPRAPSPPDWIEALSPEQAALWSTAQAAAYQRRSAESLNSLSAFLSDGTPAALRANAEYLLLLRAPGPARLIQAVALAGRSRGIRSDSGAPLSDLALLTALREMRGVDLSQGVLNALAESVRRYPSLLTPELLNAAESAASPDSAPNVRELKKEWEKLEKTRFLLRQLLSRTSDLNRPAEVWLESDSQPYLALTSPHDGVCDVSLIDTGTLDWALRASISGFDPYESVVEIAGRRRVIANAKEKTTIELATAPGVFAGRESHTFTIALLADPEPFYASHGAFTRLIRTVILIAVLSALVGLGGLWRGYRRQAALSVMKSNFVSSVSHELRAPIAAVRLMAESLDGGKVTDEAKQKHYFRLIVQECRRISSLVENVLDFSRIDQGRKQYAFEPLDLTALARHTVAVMQPCAGERGVTLAFAEPAPEAAALEPCWDHQAIEQSLVNLIDNAIKYSPLGSEVSVRIEPNGASARIWVEDHGPGIPPGEHQKVFDLFYRRGSELRRETKGSGIGLSIVKHVAEAHGGRVLLESAEGEGSRFALDLPLQPTASNGKEAR